MFSPVVEDPRPCPERALWRSVVATAVNDATGIIRCKNGSGMRNAKVVRDTARAWLLSGSKEFKLVCHLAGYDPDAVRDRARKLSRREWQTERPTRIAETLEDGQSRETDL